MRFGLYERALSDGQIALREQIVEQQSRDVLQYSEVHEVAADAIGVDTHRGAAAAFGEMDEAADIRGVRLIADQHAANIEHVAACAFGEIGDRVQTVVDSAD